MTPAFELDIQPAMRSAIGAQRGLTRDQIWSGYRELSPLHENFIQATQAGLMPHLIPPQTEQVRNIAAHWRGRPMVVIGEPAAVAAVSALAGIHAPGVVRCVCSPDPMSVRAAASAEPGSIAVVLDGPGWVRSVARHLALTMSSVVVFSGDGTADTPWSPEGAALVVSAGSADPRFGGLGLAALSVLDAVGGDVDGCAAAIREAGAQSMQPVLFENPSLLFASWIRAAERRTTLRAPTLLVPGQSMLGAARWLGGVWGALAARPEEQEPIREHFGDLASVSLLGDEAAIQRLIEGPPDRLVVLVEPREALGDVVLGETQTVWRVARALCRAHRSQIHAAGRPLMRARLAKADAASFAGFAVYWIQAAVAIGASRGGDPLVMDAADRFRSILEEDSR